jgi:hypothetical protein
LLENLIHWNSFLVEILGHELDLGLVDRRQNEWLALKEIKEI